MYKRSTGRQTTIDMVCIEDLVPKDHLLRVIDENIDFGFIAITMEPYYSSNNGRPCVDPTILVKMLLIGYLYGIRSERRICEEVSVNIAYRWFLGLSLSDSVPDHSTISQNRKRRFKDTNVFQELFDTVVKMAIDIDLVDGEVLFSDSTFLKANANKHKYTLKDRVQEATRSYINELDKAIAEDRKKFGKKPLKASIKKNNQDQSKADEEKKPDKQIKVSNTDPDSGYMVREGKPEGFFYLDHRTVDGKANIITDVYVTPGNVHDSIPYIERLDRQRSTFGLTVGSVALDSGYLTAPICHALKERDIFGVIAHRRFKPKMGYLPKWKYKYDEEKNHYTCPNGQVLTYRTTNREGYREYKSNPEACASCPFLRQCTNSKNNTKVITRHVWENDKEWVRENRLSDLGKLIYPARKETIERSFADSKELHGLRYCRMRGLVKVTEQCLLTAIAQNIKKIARTLAKLPYLRKSR